MDEVLNDKFEMEESQKQKRIIVVPSKHDIVCILQTENVTTGLQKKLVADIMD